MKKAYKRCKIFVEGEECPLCHGAQFSTVWRGRLQVLDNSRSVVAKKVGLKANGEYAIKVT